MTEPLVRPVSAGSAILSMLLSAPSPSMTSRGICAAATHVGYAEATARVAASRLVSSGDMVREGRTYTLSPQLHARRQRLDEAMSPPMKQWRRDWEIVVITATGRSAADRAAQRAELTRLGLAELREGVWLRPDNLDRALPADLADVCRRVVTRPVEDAGELAGQLWDLTAWAEAGRTLLDGLAAADDPARRFPLVVASVRHILSDPHLPGRLLPEDWPGDELRAAYAAFSAGLSAHGAAATAT